MAVPYKRKGSSSYWADIWYGGRKRSISLKTANHGVARAILHQKLAAIQHGGLQLPTRTLVAPIVSKFIMHLQATCRAKSAQTDVYRLREFFGADGVAPQDSTVSRARATRRSNARRKERVTPAYVHAVRVNFIEEVTTAIVQDFLTAIHVDRGLDPKTINEYREIIHRFFAWAIGQQDIRMADGGRTNPAAAIKRLRSADPSIRFLCATEDIHRQIEILKTKPQIQTMVAVMIYAGVRRSELLHLTKDDVDLAGRRIMVRHKDIGNLSYRTKTGRNRFVPISNALLSHLLKYHPASGSTWYFPSPEGMLWDGDNFSHQLADINQKAGLVWNCLDYRHTFGSHLAMKGESLYKIAVLMGNSPDICRRHYACLLPESLVGCVEFDRPERPSPVANVVTAVG